MFGYRESEDQRFCGWHEDPTEAGTILVKLKKSGVLGAHEVPVPNWDITTAQKLIDQFVETGKYPVD